MRVHLFDVDKTIVNTSTVKEFLFTGLKKGLIPLGIIFNVPYFFLLLTLFKPHTRNFRKPVPCLRNLSKDALDLLAEEVFQKQVLKKLNPPVAERIERIKARGERIILASSSFRTMLEPLARHFSIQEMITCELEFENGISTGRIIDLPPFQEGKKNRVLEYLQAEAIDPADCTFYSDSFRDLPLLNSIGQPVVVNPGKKLKALARKNKWLILE